MGDWGKSRPMPTAYGAAERGLAAAKVSNARVLFSSRHGFARSFLVIEFGARRRTLMKIVSVNVGLPRDVVWKGMTVRTGIFKEPVSGSVMINTLNVAGDKQSDLKVHGGVEKAVYGYPAEHYEYWRHELPDVTFSWGKFGENLTTEGLLENNLYIGDRLRVGSAVLMVTQPRMRYKLALRFDRDDMIRRFLASRRSGFYFSVVEPAEVTAGSAVEILSRDPNAVTIADIGRRYLEQN
jgi:MOSC domain-containing protein YiiM